MLIIDGDRGVVEICLPRRMLTKTADSGLGSRCVPLMVSGLTVVCLMRLLLTTSAALPMGWDEGSTIRRSEPLWPWLQRAGGIVDPRGVFEADEIRRSWQFTTQIEGHPAVAGLVIAVGNRLAACVERPLSRWRAGPIMLFAVAAGAAMYRMWQAFGPGIAVSGLLGLLTIPRLFAHVHFAGFDSPLTSFWILCWSTFDWASRSRCGWVVWSLLLGAVCSCKFTGCLAPAPFLVWSVLTRQPISCRRWLWGFLIAGLTFVNLNPPLWHDALNGCLRFLSMNVWERGERGFNIPTMLFGAIHDLDRPLPWYNAVFWIIAVMPCGTLAALVWGSWLACRRRRLQSAGLLLLLHGAVLPLVRSTPWAPPHDAERLMLPSFAFLGLLSGLGLVPLLRLICQGIQDVCRGCGMSRIASAPRWITAGLSVVWVGALAGHLVWYGPCWLSHHSLLVGGLSGAASRGLEPTYYWDALQPRVRRWLRSHTAEHECVYLSRFPPDNLALQRRWQVSSCRIRLHSPESCRWYVLQNRPGMFDAVERWMVAGCKPHYRLFLRPPDSGWGPWRTDVPLVMVYSRDQFLGVRHLVGRDGCGWR